MSRRNSHRRQRKTQLANLALGRFDAFLLLRQRRGERMGCLSRLHIDPQFSSFESGNAVLHKVEPQKQVMPIAAVMQFTDEKALPVHRSGTSIHPVDSRPQPFEVRCHFAIDVRANRTAGHLVKLIDGNPENRPREFFGRRQTQREINVCKVIAEQLVELRTIGRIVFRAIPPAPIAAFGNQQLFVGKKFTFLGNRCRLRRIHEFVVGLPRAQQIFPCSVIFLRADPDVEVRVDPGTGEDVIDLVRLHFRERFRHGQCAYPGIVGNAAIELAQKRAAIFFVVFPGVFAIQDDGHQRIPAAGNNAMAILADAIQKMVRCFHRTHSGVDETDEIA